MKRINGRRMISIPLNNDGQVLTVPNRKFGLVMKETQMRRPLIQGQRVDDCLEKKNY